jgi:transposase
VSYRIAGIDVHKRMLAVVIADVAVEGEYQFQRRKVGTSPSELCRLADWLVAEQVEEVVMESTAQYWRPVWATLEQRWRPKRLREGAGARSGQLHLAQAQSNRGAAGRKKDFPDAERLVKRLVAQELKLSFVPDDEQRLWRTVMRRKHQLTRNRVQFQNRLECLLEEAHIKLSSLVSDLLGKSARHMLQAVAEGETSPEAIAALADHRLRATAQQLCDALGACRDLHPIYRQLLKMALEELKLMEEQIDKLEQEMASLLSAIRTSCSDWRKYRDSVWIRRSRSSRNSDQRQPHFHLQNIWLHGSASALERRKVQESTTATARPKATGR